MALPPASEGDMKIAKNQEETTDAINYNTAAFVALGNQLNRGFDGIKAGVSSLGNSARFQFDFMKDQANEASLQAGQTLEASREQARKMGGMFSGFGNKLSELGVAFKTGVVDKFKEGTSSIFGKIPLILKGLLLGAGAFALFSAIKAFATGDFSDFSKAWEKIKTLFTDKIMPLISKIYNDILVPLAGFFVDTMLPILTDTFGGIIDSFMRNIDPIIQGFKDIFGDGDGGILGGITKIVIGVSTFLLESIDLILTGILKIFGVDFNDGDTLFGSIGSFFTGLYISVTEYLSTLTFGKLIDDLGAVFSSILGWVGSAVTAADEFLSQFSLYNTIKEKVMGAWESITSVFGFPSAADEFLSQFNLYNYIKQLAQDIFGSLSAIFGGDFSMESLLPGAMALFDIAFMGINSAVNIIKDIFGIGDPTEPFRMSEFISGLVSDVVGYVKEIFAFDVGSILPDIELPDLGNLIKQFIGSMLPSPDSFLGAGLYALPGTDFLKEAAELAANPPPAAPIVGQNQTAPISAPLPTTGAEIEARTGIVADTATAGSRVQDNSTVVQTTNNNVNQQSATTVVPATSRRRSARYQTRGAGGGYRPAMAFSDF